MKCLRNSFRILLLTLSVFLLGTGRASAQGSDINEGAIQVYQAIHDDLGSVADRHPLDYVFLVNTAQGASNNNPSVLLNAQSFISDFCDQVLSEEAKYSEETRSTISVRTCQLDLYPNEAHSSKLSDHAQIAQDTVHFHPTRPNGEPYHSLEGGSVQSEPRTRLLKGLGPTDHGRINIVIQLTPNPVDQPHDIRNERDNPDVAGLSSTGFDKVKEFSFNWYAHHDAKTQLYFCWVYRPTPVPSSGLVDYANLNLTTSAGGSNITTTTDGESGETPAPTQSTPPEGSPWATDIIVALCVLAVGAAAAYWCMQKSVVVIDGASFSLARFGAIKIQAEGGDRRAKLKYTIPAAKLVQPHNGTIAEVAFGIADTAPVIRAQGIQIEAAGKRGSSIVLKPDRETPVTFFAATGAGGRNNIATINIKIGKAKFS